MEPRSNPRDINATLIFEGLLLSHSLRKSEEFETGGAGRTGTAGDQIMSAGGCEHVPFLSSRKSPRARWEAWQAYPVHHEFHGTRGTRSHREHHGRLAWR